MVQLLTLLALTVSMLSSSSLLVAGFSAMPGACRLSGMKAGGTNPHGFAPSTDMTYTLAVAPSGAPNTYTVTLGGSGTFTGLLLFAQDQANATRFGSFINIPSGYAPLTTCGDINPASNTLGHNSATPKTLPVSFTWTDLGFPSYTGVFSSIIMSGTVTKWYTTQPLIFTGGNGAAAPMAMSSSMMMATTTTTSMSPAAAGATTTPAAAASSMMSSGSMMPSNSSAMPSTNATMSMMSNSSMMATTMMPAASTGASSGSTLAMTTSSSSRLGVTLPLGFLVASLMLVLSM